MDADLNKIIGETVDKFFENTDSFNIPEEIKQPEDNIMGAVNVATPMYQEGLNISDDTKLLNPHSVETFEKVAVSNGTGIGLKVTCTTNKTTIGDGEATTYLIKIEEQ